MFIRITPLLLVICLCLSSCATGDARQSTSQSVADVISQSGSVGDIPQCKEEITTEELKNQIKALGGTVDSESDVELDASFKRSAFIQGVTYPLKAGHCVVEQPGQKAQR
jgi:hypothetical protein